MCAVIVAKKGNLESPGDWSSGFPVITKCKVAGLKKTGKGATAGGRGEGAGAGPVLFRGGGGGKKVILHGRKKGATKESAGRDKAWG